VSEARSFDAEPLSPNRADIDRHLRALFPPLFVHPYPDARIEIAYADPSTGELNAAKTFSARELEKAADFAERKNRECLNVYVGPALREAHVQGRAGKNDVITAFRAWADFDRPRDDSRVATLLKTSGLQPSEVVETGRTPHRRFQVYFELVGDVTPEQLERANTSLKNWLGGDHVQNPGNLMRLAGTINYPTKAKRARGYVTELVVLHIKANASACSVEQLAGLAGTSQDSRLDPGTGPGRTDDELRTLLEASSEPGNWHNSILRAIATMVGRGWSDLQIRLACAAYCEGGTDDPDLDDMIDRAREKWNKRDPETEGDTNTDGDTIESDERSVNEAPVARTLPAIKIHQRISGADNGGRANAHQLQGAVLSAQRRIGETDHPDGEGGTWSYDQDGAIENHHSGLHARHHVPSCALAEI